MCKYPTCNRQPNTPHDDEYCIFHAPSDKKGISGKAFNELIFTEKIQVKDFNFEGYIFPDFIDFTEMLDRKNTEEFDKGVSFFESKFEGKLNKRGFPDVCVSFEGIIFKKYVYFHRTVFSGKSIFSEVKFSENVNFYNAEFFEYANFYNAVFSGDVYFNDAVFSGDVYFYGTLFSGKTSFNGTLFSKYIDFRLIIIESDINFIETIFGEKSKFLFINPEFYKKENLQIKVLFANIQFNPFNTYFENINRPKESNDELNSTILFRYCNLKDVYFTDNDVSLFSFYKSAYDEARFHSCEWKKINERRKHTICDEILYNELKKIESKEKEIKNIKNEKEKESEKFKREYQIKDLNSYNEIATLYRRFKTALDRTKDYSDAGLFYFNELEMKRKYFWDKKNFGRWLLYSLYKWFMGYGAKPLWSFLWLIFFLLLFPFIHLWNGLGVRESGILVNIPEHVFGKGFPDLNYLCTAFQFTLSRFLPSTYLPEQWRIIESTGSGLVPFFNSVILILFLFFTGIGLKRHFRRF